MIASETLAQTRGGARILRRILRYRKLAVAIPAAAGLAAGYAGYANAPAQYGAEAVLVLDARRIQALPTESVVSPLPQDSPVLRSELDIISSRMMARRVIGSLPPELAGLVARPPAPLRQRLLQTVGRYFPAAAAKAATLIGRQRADPADKSLRLEDTLLSNLRVANDGRSYTIFISYSAGDPAAAAEIANAFADDYLQYQVDVQRSGTREAAEWLGARAANLRVSLENSERSLAEFRARAHLDDANGVTTQGQRVAAAESQLFSARVAMAAAGARLDTAEGQWNGKRKLEITESTGAPLIQGLETERFRIERRIRELGDGGAAMSSELPGLKSQLATINRQLIAAAEQVLGALAAEVETARRRVAESQQALDAERLKFEAASRARVQEAQLEREAGANRSIYGSYLARYKQAIEQDGIANPGARIISRAETPGAPASPRLLNWLLLGLVAGGALGLALGLLREVTDTRVRSSALVADAVGYPVLSAIPPFRRWRRKAADGLAAAFPGPFAALYAAIRLAAPTHKGRIIAVCSDRKCEGKTTLAVSLARACAQAGMRVLVADFDFARPAIARSFAVDPAGSFEAAVSARQSLEPLICVDGASGVSVLAEAAAARSGGAALASKHFRQALFELRDSFDLVLLDGPALSRSREAWQIASLADSVIFVASRSVSRLDTMKKALEGLADAGCEVLGVVINRLADRPARPQSAGAARATEEPPAGARFGQIFEFPERA